MADVSGVWRYDTSEVIAAPASGYVRSGPVPVTRLAVSAHNSGGADVHADLLLLGNGSELLIQQVTDATLAVRYALTAAAIDHTSWVEYEVVQVATTATGPPNKNTDLLVNGWVLVAHPPYATAEELFRILKIRAPTADQQVAAERVLHVAAGEIDSKIGRIDALEGWQNDLVAEVNLERAAEHWAAEEVPFGVIGLDSPAGPTYLPRKSRALAKLLPLEQSWGVA